MAGFLPTPGSNTHNSVIIANCRRKRINADERRTRTPRRHRSVVQSISPPLISTVSSDTLQASSPRGSSRLAFESPTERLDANTIESEANPLRAEFVEQLLTPWSERSVSPLPDDNNSVNSQGYGSTINSRNEYLLNDSDEAAMAYMVATLTQSAAQAEEMITYSQTCQKIDTDHQSTLPFQASSGTLYDTDNEEDFLDSEVDWESIIHQNFIDSDIDWEVVIHQADSLADEEPPQRTVVK